MKLVLRVVLDTNVIISGLMSPKSIPGLIVQAWQKGDYTLVMSNPIIAEIQKVLKYPKINKLLKWNDKAIARFSLLLRFFTDVVDIDKVKASVPMDPDDDKILATYISGNADYLVSGDKDLLNLSDQYTIITPADFWYKYWGD